jgi:hypothetical protein
MIHAYKKVCNGVVLLIFATLQGDTVVRSLSAEERARYVKQYKEEIYNQKELAHYLSKVNNYFFVDPLKDIDIATMVKTFNDRTTLTADITAYYQNQLMRSELFWKSRQEKMTVSQMRGAMGNIATRINVLVDKYADFIAAFEKENQYDFGGATGTNPATWGPNHPRGDNVDTWEQLEKDPQKPRSAPAKRMKGGK